MADDEDERKKFEALVADAGFNGLRLVTDELIAAGAFGYGLIRPNRRRPRLSEVFIYRIRVDLDDSEPPIWRTLDVRSDLTLDSVHSVLQGAFGWNDSHLHRFSLGGKPFADESQLFLCPFDVEENEDEGIPDHLVRLDEVLQDTGDTLAYVYDYGDYWELTLRLEQVRPATEDAPLAVCVDGQRAAPPEDSGGSAHVDALAKLLDDPAFFDIQATNRGLIDPFMILRKAEIHPALMDVLWRLRGTSEGDAAERQALRLTESWPRLTPEEFRSSLQPVQWFLDRALDGGIPLTKAGYMKPPDIEHAAAVVPVCSGMPISFSREAHVRPLVHFRRALQIVGLLRKYKDRLLLTKAGQTAQWELGKLWGQLSSKLIPDKPGFERDAAAVILLFAAVPGDLPDGLIGASMARLGWVHDDGSPVDYYSVRWGTPTLDVLYNIGEPRERRLSARISPVAAALAREALAWYE